MHALSYFSPPSRIARAVLLGLAASLAACGGGGGGAADLPTVAVQFTAPVADDVFNAGIPLPLSAQVTVNGANATDGTAVQFTATAGTASAANTRNGLATTVLQNTSAGKLLLQATAVVSGRAGTGSRSVYIRLPPAALEVLVPAYFYPSGAGAVAWSALTTSVTAYPGVKITGILNPANGVFTQADPAILNAATQFSGAGGQLLGYV